VAGVALLPWYATERALSFRSSSACRCWSTWIPGSGRRGGFNPSRRSEPVTRTRASRSVGQLW